MTAVDFNSICRLCIQQTDKNNFTSIFNNENYENNVTLPERIKYSSSVEVSIYFLATMFVVLEVVGNCLYISYENVQRNIKNPLLCVISSHPLY